MASRFAFLKWLEHVRNRHVRIDLKVLVALLVFVVGVWVFLKIAGGVAGGDVPAMDAWILRSLRNPQNPKDPLGPPWVEDGMRDLTALGSVTVLGLGSLAALGYLLACRKYHAFWFVFAASSGASLLSWWLKGLFARPRPQIVPQLTIVHTASFPSGHALMSALVYLTLGTILARLVTGRVLKAYILTMAVLLTFLVGASRVYLGVHYPSDVLAGWIVGLLWALFCWLVARFLQQRRMVETVDAPGTSGSRDESKDLVCGG